LIRRGGLIIEEGRQPLLNTLIWDTLLVRIGKSGAKPSTDSPLSFQGKRCKRRVKERRSLSSNTLPLHAKNTSPYFGEGDKGDRVTINKGRGQ